MAAHSMRILLLCIFTVPFCSFAQTAYNDLKDLGYKPNTKQVTYTVYPAPVQKAGEWTSDSAFTYAKAHTFSRKGLILIDKQWTNSFESTTTFNYKDSVKVSASETHTYGKGIISHFTYTDTSVTETKTDKYGKPIVVITAILDKEKLTVKEIIRTFENEKFKSLYTVTFHGRVDGFFNRYTSVEKVKNTKEEVEITVLKRDSAGNPLSVLTKKDGKPFSYQTFKYEYWEPEPVKKVKTKASDIQDEPEWVVQEVFDAARTGSYANLSGLCCPKPDCWHDNDTEGLCNVSSASKEKQDEFRRLFEKSEIVGEPVIKGNLAEIRITYNQYGMRQATVHLVKLLGKWYLERM